MLNEFFVLFKCVESIGSGYIYMHTYAIEKNFYYCEKFSIPLLDYANSHVKCSN